MSHTWSCRFRVANVCRNLWRKKFEQYGPSVHLLPCFDTHCPQFNFAWNAMRLSLNSLRLSARPDSFGKTKLSAFGFFDPLYFLRAAISDAGTGTSRSSLFLGLNPYSGFLVTRITCVRKSISRHVK